MVHLLNVSYIFHCIVPVNYDSFFCMVGYSKGFFCFFFSDKLFFMILVNGSPYIKIYVCATEGSIMSHSWWFVTETGLSCFFWSCRRSILQKLLKVSYVRGQSCSKMVISGIRNGILFATFWFYFYAFYLIFILRSR